MSASLRIPEMVLLSSRSMRFSSSRISPSTVIEIFRAVRFGFAGMIAPRHPAVARERLVGRGTNGYMLATWESARSSSRSSVPATMLQHIR